MPTQRQLLTIATLAECLAGLGLMVNPDAGLTLLLGAEPGAVGLLVGRIAGVALLALGIACWGASGLGRCSSHGHATGNYDVQRRRGTSLDCLCGNGEGVRRCGMDRWSTSPGSRGGVRCLTLASRPGLDRPVWMIVTKPPWEA
jgi:hypothetical protein